MNKQFEVIVIGGGHAGIEAVLASSRMGCKTLLLTQSIETIGEMSCNPAIGGIGKSHIVKEIDAMDGAMARAIDKSGIQFRILNSRKGPAVRATRAQADRKLYKKSIQEILKKEENLTILKGTAEKLILKNEKAEGVITKEGLEFNSQTIILTVGTFLNGKIHIGNESYSAGRDGAKASIGLAKSLKEIGFNVARLKTGTPARLDKRTIDFSVIEEQPGDEPTPVFSFLGSVEEHPKQISCHITHTNEKTHDIIRNNINLSPMYSGNIEGVGPRYCPSIEDKIVRFSDKNRHQIFVEPEGLDAIEIYPNGLSTGLPYNVQEEFIHTIKGFESAKILRPGYAIEYDFFDPRELRFSLETKKVKNLFFAGQINGTTGYEEAGAQGLLAGINAANIVLGRDPWWPKRDESYIGVMIDDLVTKGTSEPYRMFTSRAEFRLLLREDNADLRLTEIGWKLGVVRNQRWDVFAKQRDKLNYEEKRLKSIWVRPKSELANDLKKDLNQEIVREQTAYALLKRSDFDHKKLVKNEEIGKGIDVKIAARLEIQAKYAGYIERQQKEVEKLRKNESIKIPNSFSFKNISGLSNEVVEKLEHIKPTTIGQASRIPGITPASISMLLIYLKRSIVKELHKQ